MHPALPKTLYKYYPVEDWLPSFFKGESLKFSSRNSFNDPMDSRPDFRWQLETEAGLRHAKKRLYEAGGTPALRLQRLLQLKNKFSKPRGFDKIDANTRFDQVGILSLSADWNNMLLWAHYGRMHRGVCIGFDTKAKLMQLAEPVIYTEDQPVILRPADDDNAIVQKAFFTKAKCWQYENEWRILKTGPLDDTHDHLMERMHRDGYSQDAIDLATGDLGAGIYQFDKAGIESVTVGMQISDNDLDAVKKAMRAAGLAAPLYRVRLPKSKYWLERKRAST